MLYSRKFGSWTFEIVWTGGVLVGFTLPLIPFYGNRVWSVSLTVITLVLWSEA
jgi:hypothetical protein